MLCACRERESHSEIIGSTKEHVLQEKERVFDHHCSEERKKKQKKRIRITLWFAEPGVKRGGGSWEMGYANIFFFVVCQKTNKSPSSSVASLEYGGSSSDNGGVAASNRSSSVQQYLIAVLIAETTLFSAVVGPGDNMQVCLLCLELRATLFSFFSVPFCRQLPE